MIGERLTQIREKKGLTQQQVADKLGINCDIYNQYELDMQEPTIDILNKLADLFGVSVDTILSRKYNMLRTYVTFEEANMIRIIRKIGITIEDIKDIAAVIKNHK